MGIREQRSSERLRTIWTPEMDRYFIDLMLQQVGKGNRIDDHLFSKRAWKHMTLLFNTKFKFQYEKDVLKNRHKTLRNVYKAINKLLALDGFSWDHTRHMVTAHNEVWDDYIKVHPGARSYRIKTIPYYYDLCQIYKNTSTQDSCCKILENNEDDLEVMIDEDFGAKDRAVVIDDDVDMTSGGSRARTHWQPTMDRYFIDLMLDQVHKGTQIDGLFRKQAWIEMINMFNSNFGFKYDVDVLKNRYKTFKRQYSTIKKVLEAEGFSWDDLRQMVIADDRTWQDYIEENSDARQYMTRPVPYYKDLCIVCKQVNESGSVSEDLTDDLIDEYEQEQEQEQQYGVESMNMASAVRKMANAVSCLVEKMKDEEDKCVENVIEAVQRLPDMDDDLILDACDLLEDDKKSKTFLSLDVQLRKKWLIRKLRPQHANLT